MANDEQTPDLSSLENDYQILTELHHSADSRTYLARHLGLNRDVTITIVHATDAADQQMLTQLAEDTRVLSKSRHPNIIPVIEGRLVSPDTFAIIRARVRGSTLNQLVGAVGPLPLARPALENIYAALEWARTNGVFHRQVTPDDVVFQQGSGRVLLSFDVASAMADAAWDRCADARTIGRLAWEMLAGRPADDPSGKSLAEIRPDLSPRVIAETNALMNCRREGAPPNIPAFIEMLGTPPSVLSNSAPIAPRVAQPVPGLSGPVRTGAIVGLPDGARDDSVVVVKRGMGFNTRVAVAAAVLAVIVLMALLLVRRGDPDVSFSASGAKRADTASQAAGDVGRSQAPETTAFAAHVPAVAQPAPQPVIVPPARARDTVAAPTARTSTTRDSLRDSSRDSMFAAPSSRRHEPGRPTSPSLTMPNPRAAGDSAASGDGACESSNAADQKSCLAGAIQRGDVPVNRVYKQLISALRAQAGADEGAPDPASVTQLREAQTKWLDDRDTACSDVGSGPLYAKVRAQCYADEATKRLQELKDMLDEIPKL
jgi:uncharacterized protein YecT (DUF1311 family)